MRFPACLFSGCARRGLHVAFHRAAGRVLTHCSCGRGCVPGGHGRGGGTVRTGAPILFHGGTRSATMAVTIDAPHSRVRPLLMRFQEKGGKVVVKPMPDELVAILRAAWESSEVAVGPDEYVIPNRRPASVSPGRAFSEGDLGDGAPGRRSRQGPIARSRAAGRLRRSLRRGPSGSAPRAQGPPRPRPARDDARLPPEAQEAARNGACARPLVGKRGRLRVTAECSRGAYGIRTRATAVRGRRPRPLDECAVPRQGSRSRRRLAAEKGTEAGPPASVCARCPTDDRKPSCAGRLCGNAHEISRSSSSHHSRKEARRPAARTPSLPSCPSPSPCSPHATNPEGSRDASLISQPPSVGNAPRSSFT